MDTVSRLVVIRGRVQAVGYRDAAVQSAFVNGVAGWVRNRGDGTVEALAQGSPDAVSRFVEWCRQGPPLARVTEVTVVVVEHDGALRHFEWRPTV